MIEAGLISYLLSVTAVTDLVGQRIKPVKLDPNGALPGITVNRITTSPVFRQEGATTEFKTRFQLDIWATSYSSAKTVAEELRGALDGFSGTMGATRVDSVMFLDETDDFEPENDNYRLIHDYELFHVS